jgi:small subunit ribosomal protein S3
MLWRRLRECKMEARKFIKLKKEEFGIKEYIRRDLGKGKISKLDIEYTPVGEKIIVSTSKPGLVIGRKGEKIQELTEVLKKRFKLENPHMEISEIENPLFDAQNVADEIALALERMGNLKFKVIAYRKLQEIISAGALGCELRLTGKLPSERSRSWRFAEGYLKKAGDSSKEVNRAQATGLTKTGIIGVKVAIMPPNAKIYDRVDINAEMLALIKGGVVEKVPDNEEKPKKKASKKKEEKVEKEAPSEEKIDAAGLKDGDVVKESIEVKPEEDGTAIAVEQEIEEGVSEEDDKAIEEAEVEEKIEEAEAKGKDIKEENPEGDKE